MVLVAATALTIFSLLGSAAITGLIPTAHSYRPDLAQELMTETNATMAVGETINNRMSSGTSNKELSNPQQQKACKDCGTIISIRSFDSEIDQLYSAENANIAYLIKVKMGNGNLNTVMQYSKPRYSVGDQVKLRSGKLVSA